MVHASLFFSFSTFINEAWLLKNSWYRLCQASTSGGLVSTSLGFRTQPCLEKRRKLLLLAVSLRENPQRTEERKLMLQELKMTDKELRLWNQFNIGYHMLVPKVNSCHSLSFSSKDITLTSKDWAPSFSILCSVFRKCYVLIHHQTRSHLQLLIFYFIMASCLLVVVKELIS